MKLTRRVHLCGSGAFGLTCEGDCHCYVLDGGSELALIDCGLARNPQADVYKRQILQVCKMFPRIFAKQLLWMGRGIGNSLNISHCQ